MKKRWFSRLATACLPKNLPRDAQTEHRTRLLLIFSAAVATTLLCYTLLYGTIFGSPTIAAVCGVFTLVVSLVPLIYRQTASYNLAADTLVGSGLATIAIVSVFTGGCKSPTLIWLNAVPPTACFLCGQTRLVIYACLSGLTYLTLYLVEYQFGAFPMTIPAEYLGPIQAFAVIGSAGLAAYFAHQFQGLINEEKKIVNEKTLEVQTLLQIVTHDIATPLSVIHSHTEILQSQPTITHPSIPKIARATKIIHKLLKRVISMHSVATGKAVAQLHPVPLKEIFATACFIFEEKLREKDLRLMFTGTDPSNLEVMAEPVGLANQVINNLISNAIKFSMPGTAIEINTKVTGPKVHIEIIDSGIGIPKKIIKNLFRSDHRTNRPGTSGEKGTGFGMPLAKRCIELYGGQIEIVSQAIETYPDSHGTTVKISLKKAA